MHHKPRVVSYSCCNCFKVAIIFSSLSRKALLSASRFPAQTDRSARISGRISCLSVGTGSKRSPTLLRRFGTVSILNDDGSMGTFNSLQLRGVDTGAFGL